MKKNVLLSGGTGFVGRNLTRLLVENGYSVSILSRTERTNTASVFYYKWDVATQFIDEEAVLNADFIIHLAGENIAGGRWTSQRKKQIIDSRVDSIKLLYTVLKNNNKQLQAFVTASGVGIYGAVNGAEICDENTIPANDFLGMTCQKWESAADTIASLGIRTVKIRTGLVLGKEDGFLSKLVPIFKLKLGSALGFGKQYMPWIHIDDLCTIYLKSLNDSDCIGAYNAAVTDDTTNGVFSEKLAQFYGYSIWLPNIPSFLIKMIMGEMALLLLTGRRVSSAKNQKSGFVFKYNSLDKAIKDCLTK